MLHVQNEDTGRRRGVCNQMLSPIRQRSAVQVFFLLAYPLGVSGPWFLQGSATVMCGKLLLLLLFTRCFMAVHMAL